MRIGAPLAVWVAATVAVVAAGCPASAAKEAPALPWELTPFTLGPDMSTRVDFEIHYATVIHVTALSKRYPKEVEDRVGWPVERTRPDPGEQPFELVLYDPDGAAVHTVRGALPLFLHYRVPKHTLRRGHGWHAVLRNTSLGTIGWGVLRVAFKEMETHARWRLLSGQQKTSLWWRQEGRRWPEGHATLGELGYPVTPPAKD